MALKHKYGAKRTLYNGWSYPSKLEAACAKELDRLVSTGEILFYLEQVPIKLLGGVKHRVDFLVFATDDAFFLEAKGRDLSAGKQSRKMSEAALGGVEIHIIQRPEEIRPIVCNSDTNSDNNLDK